MRTLIGFLGPLLVMGSFGIAQRQQHDSDACGFTVQGESRRSTVAEPDDIVPLVYVVEQPDSPIEIVSVGYAGNVAFSFQRPAYRAGLRQVSSPQSERPGHPAVRSRAYG
jgi:hypothetical protein